METIYNRSYRSIYALTAHLVFVAKYRKKVFTDELLVELEKVFRSILETRKCELIEFNGESDHVHLIVSYLPQISVSNLVANLKATSSKHLWSKHKDYLSSFYFGKKVLWTGSYFVSSCGGVTVDILKKYIEEQERPSQNSSHH